MAVVEVKVPQLSESVAEATLLQWKKKVGDSVAVDEILIDVETDKVVLEVPAPSAGVIIEIIQADGATVAADQLIARIDTEGKAAVAAPVAAAPAPAAAAPAPAPAASNNSMAGVAMPAAAKLMADNNMAAGSVAGTGKDGRVTKGDVLVAASAPVAKPAAAQVAAPAPVVALGERPEQRVPMTRLRARVAERLLQSQSTNAILTTFNEVNMAPVMEMRKRFQDKFEKEHGVKIGFMSFFVKAAAEALRRFPVVNASIDNNDVVYHGYQDIGVAVSTDKGLVVLFQQQLKLIVLTTQQGEIEFTASHLVAFFQMVIPCLLKGEQVGSRIVGEGDADRVGKREDDKHNHASHTGEDIAVGIGLLVHEDIETDGNDHQIEQGKHPLAAGIHHHGRITIKHCDQCRHGPLQPDVLVFLRTGIGFNRRYYFHAN